MSNRREAPGREAPDALFTSVIRIPAPRRDPQVSWATVCFHTTGITVPYSAALGRTSLLGWRTEPEHGLVVVRSDALPRPVAGTVPEQIQSCPHFVDGHPCDVHLRAVAESFEGLDLSEQADVLVGRAPLPAAEAGRRVEDLLARYPGCLVAAVPVLNAGCLVGLRDKSGRVFIIRPESDRPGGTVSPETAASVLHAWVSGGRPARELRALGPESRH